MTPGRGAAPGGAPFAAAASHHPVTAYATGEVIGAVLDSAGPRPDLAVVAATPGHAGAIEDVARAIRDTLAPTVLVGAVAPAVAAGAAPARSDRPTLALWSGHCGPVGAVKTDAAGWWAAGLARWDHTILLAATAPDPDTFGHFGPLVGGVTGGLLVADDEVYADGSVGVVIGRAGAVSSVVARGLRPFGPPQRVDAATGRVVETLAGGRPLDRLVDAARDGVPAPALRHLGRGLHLILLAGEPGPEGPTAAVAVVGTERASGALVLASEVPAGAVVRFAVPDVDAVADELAAAGAGASRAVLAFGPRRHAAALWPADRDPVAPAATLWCEAPLQLGAAGDGSVTHEETTAAALFPDPWAAVRGGG